MRIIVAGSRGITEYNVVRQVVLETIEKLGLEGKTSKVEIVSGGARGVDTLGERLAQEQGFGLKVFKADWGSINAPGAVIKYNQYGAYNASAGYTRNCQMAEYAVQDEEQGVLVAIWDGRSRGTKHMIDIAEERGLRVEKYIR